MSCRGRQVHAPAVIRLSVFQLILSATLLIEGGRGEGGRGEAALQAASDRGENHLIAHGWSHL